MTKRDYIRAAAMVQQDRKQLGEAIGQMTMETFIKFFAGDNPRFNADSFREACKV